MFTVCIQGDVVTAIEAIKHRFGRLLIEKEVSIRSVRSEDQQAIIGLDAPRPLSRILDCWSEESATLVSWRYDNGI